MSTGAAAVGPSPGSCARHSHRSAIAGCRSGASTASPSSSPAISPSRFSGWGMSSAACVNPGLRHGLRGKRAMC
eukprot:15455093-Alexandrium_andersonii.AAC.1